MKKRNFTIIIISILCLAMAITVIACTIPDNIAGNNNNNNNNSQEFESNLVGISASSAALLLDEMQFANAGIATFKEDSQEGQTLSQEDIDLVKEQLALLENYMGENAPTIVQESIGSGDAYYGEYEYKMTITTKDMHGKNYNYTIYFNQTLIKEGVEYDDDDYIGSGNQEYESFDEYRIEGIVVSGENTYTMIGEKTNETEYEEGETESESTFKMIVKQSESKYIEFEQTIEKEANESEQKYEYKVYDNKKLIKQFELEFEEELGESEVEMKSIENGQIFQVKYESEMHQGKERIKAEITKGDKLIEVYIRVEGTGTEEDPYRHIYTYGEIEDVEYDD